MNDIEAIASERKGLAREVLRLERAVIDFGNEDLRSAYESTHSLLHYELLLFSAVSTREALRRGPSDQL